LKSNILNFNLTKFNSKIGFKLIKENGMHIGGEGIEHDVEKKKLLKKLKSEKPTFYASLFENGLNLS
jgi:hypothetical protein